MSKVMDPSHLIWLQDGPRAGHILIAERHGGGAVCVSPVPGEQPRIDRELLYHDTGQRTATGMRIYQLAVPGRVGANVREGA